MVKTLPDDEAKNQNGPRMINDAMLPAAMSLNRNLRLIFSRRSEGTARRKTGIRYLSKEREKA